MRQKAQPYLLYALFLTLPFERILTYEIAGLRIKPSYIVAILLFIFVLSRLKTIWREKPRSYEWALLVFWLIAMATTLWSPYKFLTFSLNLVILMAFLIFYISRRYLKELVPDKVINIFIWLGVATAIFGFWQFIGDSLDVSQRFTGISTIYLKHVFGFPRVQSTFFEPSFYANFLLMPLFLSLYTVIKSGGRLNYLRTLLLGSIFFLTLSRGGFIAGGIGLLVMAIWTFLRERHYFRGFINAFACLLVSFVVSVFAVYLSAGSNGVDSYLGQAQNSSDVVSAEKYNELSPNRGYTVRVAFKNFTKHPLGLGTGAFGSLPEFEQIRAAGNARQTVNSIYPEILIENGILGLAAFITFIILLFWNLLKNSRKSYLNLVLLAAVLAIFIQFWSFSTYHLVYIWVFLAFAASAGGLALKPKQ